jgi:hypothetical protein
MRTEAHCSLCWNALPPQHIRSPCSSPPAAHPAVTLTCSILAISHFLPWTPILYPQPQAMLQTQTFRSTSPPTKCPSGLWARCPNAMADKGPARSPAESRLTITTWQTWPRQSSE